MSSPAEHAVAARRVDDDEILCGKTTLAANLAVAAEKFGVGPVMLIDTDPQATLTYWWKDRETKLPGLIKRPGAEETDLASSMVSGANQATSMLFDIEALREFGANLIIIDTPPGVTSETRRAVQSADLVLVPVRPSPHDLRASAVTMQMAKGLGKEAAFVLNAATVRSRISADAIVALSQHGSLAPVVLHQRVDYASSMIDGGTVVESRPASPAAREIEALWNYVAGRLEGRVDMALRHVG